MIFEESQPYEFIHQYQQEMYQNGITSQKCSNYFAINQQNQISIPLSLPSLSSPQSSPLNSISTLPVTSLPVGLMQATRQHESFNFEDFLWNAQTHISVAQAEEQISEAEEEEWAPSHINPVNASPIDVNKDNRKNFSTTDYVIKHCLRMMMGSEIRGEIMLLCNKHKVSYQNLIRFWRNLVGNLKGFIGVNRFKKYLSQRSGFVQVCVQFFEDYLTLDYSAYVIRSRLRNKSFYLSCATKLLYILRESPKKLTKDTKSSN